VAFGMGCAPYLMAVRSRETRIRSRETRVRSRETRVRSRETRSGRGVGRAGVVPAEILPTKLRALVLAEFDLVGGARVTAREAAIQASPLTVARAAGLAVRALRGAAVAEVSDHTHGADLVLRGASGGHTTVLGANARMEALAAGGRAGVGAPGAAARGATRDARRAAAEVAVDAGADALVAARQADGLAAVLVGARLRVEVGGAGQRVPLGWLWRVGQAEVAVSGEAVDRRAIGPRGGPLTRPREPVVDGRRAGIPGRGNGRLGGRWRPTLANGRWRRAIGLPTGARDEYREAEQGDGQQTAESVVGRGHRLEGRRYSRGRGAGDVWVDDDATNTAADTGADRGDRGAW
jgi:hypothetical protein